MIAGLSQHPWIQLAAHRDGDSVSHLLDCEDCKGCFGKVSRQMIGCGHEEPSEHATPWRHPGYTGPDATSCPGYAAQLPMVRERTWQLHWMKTGGHGTLVAELGHEPTQDDMRELRTLEAQILASESWAMRNPPEPKK